MSLIYSALRSSDTRPGKGAAPAAPAAGVGARRSGGSSGRSRDLGVIALGIAVGLLLALSVQWFEWSPTSVGQENIGPALSAEPVFSQPDAQQASGQTAHLPPVIAPLPSASSGQPEALSMADNELAGRADVPTAPVLPERVDTDLTQAAPDANSTLMAPSQRSAQAAAVAPSSVDAPTPPVENATSQGVVTSRDRAPREPVRVERLDEPEPSMNPEQRISAMRRAMAEGETLLAARHLQALESALPESSLTLLRVRAWWHRENNETDRAIMLYQQVLERLPDDMDAGLNLAALYWQEQRTDSALDLLRDLRQRHPESVPVERYWQIMRPGRRG